VLFATDSLAGLASGTMISNLSAAMCGYHVEIVETNREQSEQDGDASRLTVFVDEEACARFALSPDEIGLFI
jgi:hypothetical protein